MHHFLFKGFLFFVLKTKPTSGTSCLEQQVSNIFMNWREAESQLCLKTHSSKLGGRPQDTKAIFDWLEKLTRPEVSHTQDDWDLKSRLLQY